ncbi:MAG: beta-ketoacyl synthase N-terminal-like domain-containing protein [Cyanobacteria bacterium P01_A01_bin.105]
MSDSLKNAANNAEIASNPDTASTAERVFRALREARSQLEAIEEARNERVAIIGMAGRFPGADDLKEFWQLLIEGKTGIRRLTADELRAAGVPDSEFSKPNYVPAYASFSDPTAFDAHFFGYSPREAELMDPQHRVFLECAWSALEDAGYDSQQYEGAIGVYGGAALNSYVVNLHNNAAVREATDPVQAVVSNVMGLMPTRVSYQMDLTGPSCGIQTGCSTALVAIHTACQSLLHHECDMALAGGVTVSQATPQGYIYQADSIAAPDGVCRAFDANGQGTLFGNGVGIVVLKRLQAALRDGDHIYAVIKGSAINNDGADKVGLTAPSVSGQAAVIRAAMDQAGIDPSTISYVEGHGTGTALGDPIEVAALNRAFRPLQKASKQIAAHRCALGSVKTNLGHLDAAAGAAGVIKTALALKQGELPPSLNFQTPNPKIDFDQGPFFVSPQRQVWADNGTPRRAGVSSFGMGGTNAHLILEAAPAAESGSRSRPWQLLMLSAKTPTALEQMAKNLVAHLQETPDIALPDVAHTLQVGRRPWPYRRTYLYQTTAEAVDLLQSQDSPLRQSGTARQVTHSVVFMFSGQGAQHPNMALDLYESEPIFQQAIDRCAAILDRDFPLLAVLYHRQSTSNGVTPSPKYPLTHTENAQPALFAVEYALAQLWMSWGIKPQAVIGHSIGEYVAACVAGVFSLEDALKIILQRGRLMQRCAPGAMLAVLQPAEAVMPHLLPETEISVINSPQTCVVSGPTAAISTLKSRLEALPVPCRLLETSHAFHSALMESALAKFAQVMASVSLHVPQIEVVSNVTGTWLTDAEATSPDYWVSHLRQPVQFSQGVNALLHLSDPIFLELGPGHTLTKLVRQHVTSEHPPVLAVQTLPHPRENKPDTVTLMTALAQLWTAGIIVSWCDFYQAEQRRRLPLPTYPFERESYWIAPTLASATSASLTSKSVSGPDGSDPISGDQKAEISDWFYLPTWKRVPLTATTAECGPWVIFTEPSEKDSLWQSLGNNVTWVEPGEAFAVEGEDYTLRANTPSDYQQLVDQLRDLNLTQIIYAWQEGQNFDSLKALMHLVQALANSGLGELTLTLITRNAHSVTGGESLEPHQAKLMGFAQVVSQEYPALHCRQIDIDAAISAGGVMGSNKKTVDQLNQALGSPYSQDSRVVAYRHGQRWLQVYEPFPLATAQSQHLRGGGTYLIAGDLVDGLGMTYARALVRDYNAKLILIGRPGLPAASDWERWLATHGPQHSVSRLVRQLQALGREGETFLWASGSLADRDWLQSVIRQGTEQLGKITGVFHAGVMGDQASRLIAELDGEGCDRICRTKVDGIQSLQTVLADQPISFYLLQSSLSAIVGGSGFGAYAAANSYLDATAHQQTGDVHWLSLNWDACQWDEVEATDQSELMAAALSAEEVWLATQRALAQPDCSQLVVTPRSLSTRLTTAFTPPIVPAAQPDTTHHRRPSLSPPYVAPRNDIEQTVAQAMGDLLGIEQVGVDDNFFELGGHSLLAIQAVTRLREEFQVELPMRAFLFEAPTVAGIAKLIAENQPTFSVETQATLENLLDQIEGMNPEEIGQKI